MAMWYETPTVRFYSMKEFQAPFWDVIGAQTGQVWTESPMQSVIDLGKKFLAGSDPDDPLGLNPSLEAQGRAPLGTGANPILTKDVAEQRIAEAGLKGALKYTQGMREGELDLLVSEKRKELARRDIMNRAEGGALQNIVGFGASLLTALADPINVASAFVPVVGPSRYAYMVGKAGSAAGRLGTRLGVGAVEGAVGQALVEPLVAVAQAEFQREYGLLNSFMAVAFGGAFGGGLHGAGGAVMDAIRPGRVAMMRGYARWADDTTLMSRELGLDLEPRLDMFRAELAGRIEEGQFGPRTRDAWERYRDETAAAAKDFDLPLTATPDDFIRWLRYSRRARQPDAKMTSADIAAPRETIPEYDLALDQPLARSFMEGPDGARADVAPPSVRPQPQPSIYRAFMDEVGEDARETAFRYAASRFAWGKVADTVPIYHAFGIQKRLSEATQLSTPAAREMVASLTTANARFSPGYWGQGFGTRVDYGDMGPRLTVRPDGIRIGDKVEWERFGEKQFDEPRRVTEVGDDGRVKIDGWSQWIRPGEVTLAEAGPAARTHRYEIEWGDLWAEVQDSQALMPALARQRGARDLLGVLRNEQTVDPKPVFDAMRAAERPEADMLYVKPDRAAMTSATARVEGRAKAEAVAIRETPEAPKRETDDPMRVVGEVASVKDSETAALRLAADHIKTWGVVIKGVDAAIEQAPPGARAELEAFRAQIDKRRAELAEAVDARTGPVREGGQDTGTQRAGESGAGKGVAPDARPDAAKAEVPGAGREGPVDRYPTPDEDAKIVEHDTRARAAAEMRGDLPAYEKMMKEADEDIAKAEAEASWMEAYAACVARTT